MSGIEIETSPIPIRLIESDGCLPRLDGRAHAPDALLEAPTDLTSARELWPGSGPMCVVLS